jgi:hypothetical protein
MHLVAWHPHPSFFVSSHYARAKTYWLLGYASTIYQASMKYSQQNMSVLTFIRD